MSDIMTAPKLGRRTFKVNGDLLCQMFEPGPHRGYAIVRDGLPADARIVEARWDGHFEVLTLYIVSASFASDHMTDYDQEITPIAEVA